MYYVYALFRPDNGHIFYIGASSRDKRIGEVGGPRHSRRNKMMKAFLELGYPEIPAVVLRDNLNYVQAFELEALFINTLGISPSGPLANVYRGGGLSSPSTRERMSASAKARDRNNEAEERRIARMSDPDVRAKMSAAAKRRKRTPEFEAKRLAAALAPDVQARRLASWGKRRWITNGLTDEHVRAEDPIPDGWWVGRSSGSLTTAELAQREAARRQNRQKWLAENRSRVWITDGEKSRRALPTDPIPEGWHLGRTL